MNSRSLLRDAKAGTTESSTRTMACEAGPVSSKANVQDLADSVDLAGKRVFVRVSIHDEHIRTSATCPEIDICFCVNVAYSHRLAEVLVTCTVNATSSWLCVTCFSQPSLGEKKFDALASFVRRNACHQTYNTSQASRSLFDTPGPGRFT